MTSTGSSRKGGALAQFRQVYCWQLKKNRILSIVYGALTLLCFTIVYLCRSIGQHQEYFLDNTGEWSGMSQSQLMELFSEDMATNLNQLVYLALIPLSLLFLVVFSVTAFGYMHRRRSVDLFHALPVRRTPLLLGNLAAGYTVLVLVVTVNSLLCGGIGLALGVGKPFTFPWLLEGIGYQLLLLAAALVLTLFLLVASGTVVNAVLSGILLSLGWPILCYCSASIIQMTLPGSTLEVSGMVTTALVPYLALFLPFLTYGPVDMISSLASSVVRYGGETYAINGDGGYELFPLLILWWCVFTALLLAVSILVYRKRKSECAENNFSFPALRTVIQFLVSAAFGLGCGLVFGQILHQSWVFFLAVLIGAAVAHTVSQLLWAKGMRNFKRSLPVYGVLLVSLCVFFVGLATGGLGYVTRIPNPTQVDSVTLEMPSYYYGDSLESYLAQTNGLSVWNNQSDDDDYAGLDVMPQLTKMDNIKVEQEMHQAIIDSYAAPYLPFRGRDAEGYNSCKITYQLSNGKTVERTYLLPVETWDETSGQTTWSTGQNAWPTDLSEETLQKMAAVIALDEYQVYNLYYYQDASQIAGVSTNRVEQKGEYNGARILSKEQQKKLWSTFRKELESDQFRYTSKDASGVYTDGETSYCIEMESVWQIKQWPDDLKELLRDRIKAKFPEKYWDSLTIENGAGSNLYVPESCTQTRKLIKEYIGDNVEYMPYDEEEKD